MTWLSFARAPAWVILASFGIAHAYDNRDRMLTLGVNGPGGRIG